ncbi:MAG: hypothetical protein V2A34_06390, partial [Lentisphaerota bacterium]
FLVIPLGFHLLNSWLWTGNPAPVRRPFPWWGWCGVALGMAAWILAWSRFSWFKTLQSFTFSPLWLAYILVVNALTWRRAGQCLLTDQPRFFAALFPVSAAFWWFFEYLNRFVQNWYYVGVDTLTPLQYFLYATIPFATVLPAVLSTKEWLSVFFHPPPAADGRTGPRKGSGKRLPWIIFTLSSAGLMGVGIWPDVLFPLLWIAPLLSLVSWQAIRGKKTLLFNTGSGSWHSICLLALSALICGFFWEMWNFHSLAKWIYTVPFLNRFHLFEMPLLGYGGYLPFGLECAVIGEMLHAWVNRFSGCE